MGFEMALQFNSMTNQFTLSLKGSRTHSIELGADAFGNITRINNIFANLPITLEQTKEELARTESQLEAAKVEITKPFLLADELAEKELKLAEINTKLNIGNETATVEAVGETNVADGNALPKMSSADFLKNIGEFNAGKRTDFVGDSMDYDDDEIAV